MNAYTAVFVVVLGLAAGGCSVRGDCETVCEWGEKCGDQESDCVDDCVDDYEDADDACQDAFDELAACVEEDDSCDTDSDCASEYLAFLDDCADDR
ncbi:MAG TPA: hypothetical protein VFZ53_27810 [Polyangiaceae bacterium]